MHDEFDYAIEAASTAFWQAFAAVHGPPLLSGDYTPEMHAKFDATAREVAREYVEVNTLETEPRFGIWMSPEQVNTLDHYLHDPRASRYARADGGTVKITDMRSGYVVANLPDELGDLSDYRGAILVEQDTAGGGVDSIQRCAIIDREGSLFVLDPSHMREPGEW